MTAPAGSGADAVLQALTAAAVRIVGAELGWMLARVGEELEVVGVGGGAPRQLRGMRVPMGAGTAGFVASTGQNLTLAQRAGEPPDPRLGEGVAAFLSRALPQTVLTVPCATDTAVLGALELVDKRGGGSFSFDDAETASLLGFVAGVALTPDPTTTAPPRPAQLSTQLARIAADDPERYAALAFAVDALLQRA